MDLNLKYLPVLVNLENGALSKSQWEEALREWDALYKHIERLELNKPRTEIYRGSFIQAWRQPSLVPDNLYPKKQQYHIICRIYRPAPNPKDAMMIDLSERADGNRFSSVKEAIKHGKDYEDHVQNFNATPPGDWRRNKLYYTMDNQFAKIYEVEGHQLLIRLDLEEGDDVLIIETYFNRDHVQATLGTGEDSATIFNAITEERAPQYFNYLKQSYNGQA